MPLIHSKKPSAFKHNVREMMHAGHPQNQSLAAAYSVQRKAQHHKMGHGGSVEDCPHCMAEGGSIEEKRAARAQNHPVSISGGPGREESRHGQVSPNALQRGVSSSWSEGKSSGHHMDTAGKYGSENNTSYRKSEAKENLSDLKSQNPKLKGLAEGGEVEMDEDPDSELHEQVGHEIMEAIHSKDHKKLMSGIEALVLHHMNKRED